MYQRGGVAVYLRAFLGVGGPLLLHAGFQQLQEVKAVQGVAASLHLILVVHLFLLQTNYNKCIKI